jgi:iron-sulfur cluster assembly accessory protein
MNVTMTPAAEKFIRRMVRFGGAGEDAGFRLIVTPGGCAGYNSEFSVESEPKAGDATMNINGVKLFLPAESRLMLEGVTIDFADTPTQSGLTFINPNAAAHSCGSSVGATPPAQATVSIASIQRRA